MSEQIRVSLPGEGQFLLRELLTTSLVYLACFSESRLETPDSNTIIVKPGDIKRGLEELIVECTKILQEIPAERVVIGNDLRNILPRVTSTLGGEAKGGKVKDKLLTLFRLYQNYVLSKDEGELIRELAEDLSNVFVRSESRRRRGSKTEREDKYMCFAPLTIFKLQYAEYTRSITSNVKISDCFRIRLHTLVLGLAGAILGLCSVAEDKITLLLMTPEDAEFRYSEVDSAKMHERINEHREIKHRLRYYASETCRLLHIALVRPSMSGLYKIFEMYTSSNRLDLIRVTTLGIKDTRLALFAKYLEERARNEEWARRLKDKLAKLVELAAASGQRRDIEPQIKHALVDIVEKLYIVIENYDNVDLRERLLYDISRTSLAYRLTTSKDLQRYVHLLPTLYDVALIRRILDELQSR